MTFKGFLVQAYKFFHIPPINEFQRPENHMIRFTKAVGPCLHPNVLVSFPSFFLITLTKREVYPVSDFWEVMPSMTEKAWNQKQEEAVGHIGSTLNKHRVIIPCGQLNFSFIFGLGSLPSPHEMLLTHI